MVVAAAKAGFGFCASSEEEGFSEATEMGGEEGAATMAGLRRGAAAKAGLFCASSEEEDFGNVTSKGGAGLPRQWQALEEAAAVSLMGASTGLEVAAVMAGLMGAAAAVADSQRW
jgi:hypothetical protein